MRADLNFNDITSHGTRVLSFEFAGRNWIPAGVTITGAEFVIGVHSGTDADPSAIKSGSASYDAAAETISQKVAGCKAGVTYTVLGLATGSDGEVYDVWALLRCVDPS